ncbi:TD and POZ domain-containing protein 4 [Araneus ventricosus]|uniref:TD and POZ domain-containing protein 4 n=1 Tax=Araneus ventricosus TaxID=182803 RepID=A0A4Y2HXF0_ARAVE|nr:TD and POZ domain-containing protein 4 [Araneus ventricosus]
MNSGKKEYSFLWFIENYSYCGRNLKEKLVSPEFMPEGQEGTSWSILLHPGYLKDKRGELNSVYLKRSAHDAGPESFSLKLEISVITENGSTLYSEECEHKFRKGAKRGFHPLLDMDELYVRKNTEYLPRDTLGVRCRMWKGEGNVQNVGQCSARTRIGIQKISFLHRVKNFSAFKLYEENTIQIPSHSKTGYLLSSSLSVCHAMAGNEPVIVEIFPFDSNYFLWRKTLSLLDISGNNIEFGDVDYRFFVEAQQIEKRYKSFTRRFIMNNRNEYLPNDELSLLCECTFATGVEFEKIEESLHEIPMAAIKNRFYSAHSKHESQPAKKLSHHSSASEDTKMNHNNQCLTNVELNAKTFSTNCNAPSTRPIVALNQMENNDPNKIMYNVAEKLSMCPSALDDFKALYNDHLLTDVVLKTATKSFPAHKNVLCARSSVFRAMLTSDMKEKNTDCIKVEDLENETVHRLLLFLYSDNLEELQWESALKLYYAGDKYAIEKLKVLCSSFLVDSLSTSTASELLLLADTHSDTDLKKFVEDFILEHEEEVFGSDEWEKLIDTNPHLVIKTMHLKYRKKKGGK